MVIVNTQRYQDLSFRYFLEIPRCDILFGSARETTGKSHLFLFYKSEDRIYKRNGLARTWVELKSTPERNEVHSVLSSAISDPGIPRYNVEKMALN